MKQLEKKDLIIGEIYFKNSFIFKHVNTNPYLCDNYTIRGLDNRYYHGNGHIKLYNEFPQRLATPKEKHWLEVCIAANGFISYEEAMKTFIPEYVECTENHKFSYYILGKIYKVSNNRGMIEDPNGGAIWRFNEYRFKPSTKEAYDAQFVVKESEFVLPEKWCLKITKENLDFCKSLNEGQLHYARNYNYHINGYYSAIRSANRMYSFSGIPQGFVEITFEQFKKYVLKEQLEEPKDKVLSSMKKNFESIIHTVESSEGAIYQLGDKVTVFTKDSPNKGKVFTIKGFRWNNAKTNICAITELHSKNGIGLDKIELYSKPVIKELSLLEQAKLKYPVGTKVKSMISGKIVEIKKDSFQFSSSKEMLSYDYGVVLLFDSKKWAEIVDDFKLPETCKTKIKK